MQTNSGQPCGICGDIGNAKDIATCSKCRKSREHIYCMNPNLFNVPRSWHCEACQRDNLVRRNTSHSDGSRRNVEVQESSKRQKTWISENASSQVPDASNGICSPSSKCGSHFLSKNVVPKKVANGKVKYIPTEDVCGPSGFKSKLNSVLGASNSQMRSSGANRSSILKRTSAAPKSFPEKVRAYKSVSHLKPPTVCEVTFSTLQKPAVELSQSFGGSKSQLPYPCKSPTRENFRYMADLNVRDKRHIGEAHPSPFSHTGTNASGVQERPEFGKTSPRPKIDAGKVDSLPAKDYVCKDKAVEVPYKFGEEDLPNPPAIVASWKGCFEMLSFFRELCDGFQAYLPEKVSSKAYVVSRQLPRVLKFTLLPRRDVWPEIFHSKSPCAFDIALYFWFDEFCRENYNRLIELMEKQDLSMRSHLDGADLLIFTSRHLPIESQRMNMQFYLWGAFHSSKAQQAVEAPLCNYTVSEDPVSISHKADDQGVDKGIEIVASEGVRIVDKWMTSNPNATCKDDSQDAFSRIHSNQPVQNSTASWHAHDELKREQWNGLDDAPPGYSRSDDAPPGYSLSDDAPPGFSIPVTINASDDSHIAPPHPKMSHVAKDVNTPSSNWTKLREKVSSSKVTASENLRAKLPDENSVRGLHPLMKTADLPVHPWKESNDGRTRVSTQSRENSGRGRGRGLHPLMKTADLPSRPWKESHDGRTRVSTQSRENSTRDPILSKKLHDGKDLLAEQASECGFSWDHMILPKKECNNGWGKQEGVAIQSNENDGWGNRQSVATQSSIPSKKIDDGKNLLAQQAGEENSWDHIIPPKKEYHEGWESVSIESSEKDGPHPISSRKIDHGKEDLLVKQASGHKGGWDHMIPPKRTNYDGWGKKSIAMQSKENNVDRNSTGKKVGKKSNEDDNNGRDLRWDLTLPKKEHYDRWATNSISPTQSNGRDLWRDHIRPEREPCHVWRRDFTTTKSREENARRDLPAIRSKSEPRNGKGKDFASTQSRDENARRDAPIRPNKHNEREHDIGTRREHNDGWRKNRR